MSVKLYALASALFTCFWILSPSYATFLRGYVARQDEPPTNQNTATANTCNYKETSKIDSVLENNSISVSAAINSFPANFEGKWQCATEVTNSALPTIDIGQRIFSELVFVKTPNGQVLAKWHQPDWKETQVTIVSYNSNIATTDRTTYYYGQGSHGSWAARSRNQFTQIAANKIIALSYVDQYIDGQYLGRYHTKSVLIKEESDTPQP